MTATATTPDADVATAHAALHADRPLLKGWSHVVAALAAITLCPILIALSPAGTRAAAAIYSGCVIGLFAVSAAYHRFRWQPAVHQFMRRLDHSMIFVVIAATYTPIAWVALPPTEGRIILAVVWAGALAGALSYLLWPGTPRWLHVSLYLGVGWVALTVIDEIWHAVGVVGFVLLLAGGLAHTIGAVVYALKRPNPWPTIFGFHEIFHLFVIAGIACHYIVVAFYALR